MNVFVVDTNVAIAANGRDTHADTKCQLRCVEQLKLVVEREVVAVDDKGLVTEEYQNRLIFAGAPGVGDAFWKHVFNNQYLEERVRRVTITPSDDDKRGFEELPENTFDQSDRKFLAVAVVAGAEVLNATDNDWSEHETLMQQLEVEVEQLCPQHLYGRNGVDS